MTRTINKKSLFIIVVVLIAFIPNYSTNVEALNDIDLFNLRLVDEYGQDTDKVLAQSYTVDTVTTISGTTIT